MENSFTNINKFGMLESGLLAKLKEDKIKAKPEINPGHIGRNSDLSDFRGPSISLLHNESVY